VTNNQSFIRVVPPSGKPIKDSEGETGRLIDTIRIAAEESVRMAGEVQPLDISPPACQALISIPVRSPNVGGGEFRSVVVSH
jgi:acyl-CoA reductase-like NAD-dependent aldehyde dehydrogenase